MFYRFFCAVDNSSVSDLSAAGDTIVWYDQPVDGNQLNDTDLLIDGTTYYADDIGNNSCSTSRLAIEVSIYGAPPTNVDVYVGKCASENPTLNDLNASGSAIQWFDAQTDGNLLPSNHLLENGVTYWVQQTENGCISNRLPTTVNLIDPPLPTIETSQSFCSEPNPTVADLVATESNVVWYDSETSLFPLDATTPLVDGEDYWATQFTFPCESTTRVQTTVNIDTKPNAGISNTYNDCEIDAVETNLFDLLGGSPTTDGVWSGPSSLGNNHFGTFDPLTNENGLYTYTVSSDLGVCEDAIATINVNIVKVLPPTINEVSQTFCEIDNPTVENLSAVGSEILWYDEETSGLPLDPSETLIDGQDYWASQTNSTSGCESLTRTAVNVIIESIPPPTISNVSQIFCDIDNPTIADISIEGSGVLWYDLEDSTTPLDPTILLTDGEDYWASQSGGITSCESKTRSVVTVTIQSVQPPTTNMANQVFCEVDNSTVADLSAIGNEIQWYDMEDSTTPLNLTDTLINGEDYWASQTDMTVGCESTGRLMVSVTIISPPAPTVSETTQVFCEIDNPTVEDLIATGNEIQWYISETSNTPIDVTDSLLNNQEYWASQIDPISGCETVARTKVTVNIIAPEPPITSEISQLFCDIDNPTIANIAVEGTGVLWYDLEDSTIPLDPTISLTDGEDYWATQTNDDGTCVSATRLKVTVTINSPLPPVINNVMQTFCRNNNPTVADLNASGTSITWYDLEDSTTSLNSTDLLIDGEDYWASQSNVNGCESITRSVVTVNIVDTLPPTTNQVSQSFCASDSPQISDLSINGNNVLWYDSESSTSALNLEDLLIDGEDYWATQSNTSTGCYSSVRTVVNVVLTDPGTPSITALGYEFCKIEEPTLNDLNENISSNSGGIIDWYDSYPNGSLLSLSEQLIEGGIYYAVETNSNGCSSVAPLEVTVTLESCDEYDVKIFDGFSPSGNGINDTFTVENLRILYPNFKMEFFNRWGDKVYTANASKPDWNGRYNGDGELVPAGVYYVIVYFNKNNRKPIQRRLYLSR